GRRRCGARTRATPTGRTSFASSPSASAERCDPPRMTFNLFDLPAREASQFVGFAGNVIDRDAENRTDASVATALADDRVRMILFSGPKLLLKIAGDRLDPWFVRGEAEQYLANLGD